MTGDTFEFGDAVGLFDTHVPRLVTQTGGVHQQYDVSSDAQRFLVNTLVADPGLPPITLVLNCHFPSEGDAR